MRVKLTLGYDGTDFHGFQVQSRIEPGLKDPDAVRTVQGELERALRELYGVGIRITGAGRTDVGVHARGQCVSFEPPEQPAIPPKQLPAALNGRLPRDLRIFLGETVSDTFHAQASARGKIYRYLIYNDRVSQPSLRRTHWHVRFPLDAERMRSAARHLVGEHDFKSFVNALENIQAQRTADGKEPLSTVKTIFRIEVKWLGDPWETSPRDTKDPHYPVLAIEVEGSGFLYKMVRNIVGTLVEVGRGYREPQWVAEVLAAKDRAVAGPTAEPHGLYLQRVKY